MYGRLRDCLVGDQGILWRCPADWLLVVIVALVVSGFAFSPDSQPPVEGFCNWDIGTDFKGADKIKHFIAFAALGCFLYRGVYRCTQFAEFWCVVLACAGGISFGILIEVLQPRVGRYCDINDLAADVLGMLSGVLLWRFIRAIVPRITPGGSCVSRLIDRL